MPAVGVNPQHLRPGRVQQVRAIKVAAVGTLCVAVIAYLAASSGFLATTVGDSRSEEHHNHGVIQETAAAATPAVLHTRSSRDDAAAAVVEAEEKEEDVEGEEQEKQKQLQPEAEDLGAGGDRSNDDSGGGGGGENQGDSDGEQTQPQSPSPEEEEAKAKTAKEQERHDEELEAKKSDDDVTGEEKKKKGDSDPSSPSPSLLPEEQPAAADGNGHKHGTNQSEMRKEEASPKVKDETPPLTKQSSSSSSSSSPSNATIEAQASAPPTTEGMTVVEDTDTSRVAPPPRPPPLNPFTSNPGPPPNFDNLGIVRRLAGQFKRKCALVNGFFQEAGARYHRLERHGVIVIDWSENYFNGIGDEMQHYQEMVAIGLGTGRATYLKTQKAGCVGTGLAGAKEPPGAAHLATECHYDLGDFYTGIHGVDWKWDDNKEEQVREQLGADEKELVVTWSTKGMYFGRSAEHNEDVSPTGEYVAPPEANLVKVLMENDEFKNHKIVRVRIKLNFGHWCHPHQKTSWGMCESYRWVAGIEGHAPSSGQSSPCPECTYGSCFGAAMLQPRPALKLKLAPYIAQMEEKKWSTMVGFHIRVGFADMSQVTPPDAERTEEATIETIDAFLRSESTRVPYPAPDCPDKTFGGGGGGGGGGGDVDSAKDGPLSIFLKCVVSTAETLSKRGLGGTGRGGGGDPGEWGVFMTTDSPAMRVVVEKQFDRNPRLAGKVIVTDGAYGNVKFSNTGVCVDDGEGTGCDASDPRGAWEKSMVDLYLVGLSDLVLMLFQSKFTNAATMRADVPHGIREVYRNTRITHSLVDGVVGRMAHGGFGASPEDKKIWVKLWDLFGPPGKRKALRTSKFASSG